MTLRKFQEPRLTTKEKRCLTYLANKSDDGNTPLLVVELASNIQQRIVTLFEHLDAQIPPIYQRNFIYNMP